MAFKNRLEIKTPGTAAPDAWSVRFGIKYGMTRARTQVSGGALAEEIFCFFVDID